MKSRRHIPQASADGLKGLCACQLAASPSAGRGVRRQRRHQRQRRYRAKYTPCQPSRRCGSSSRLMGCGMPDYGFGRCDGHHKMIDFRLEKSNGTAASWISVCGECGGRGQLNYSCPNRACHSPPPHVAIATNYRDQKLRACVEDKPNSS